MTCRCRWILALLVAHVFTSPTHAQPKANETPGLTLSHPVEFDISMTTELAVPKDRVLAQVRVSHALPTPKSWSGTMGRHAARNVSVEPNLARIDVHDESQSAYLVWTTGRQAGESKLAFTSKFTVRSTRRTFDPRALAITWSDFARIPRDGETAIHPALVRLAPAQVVRIADGIRAKFHPAEAVLEMCKWIAKEVQYDAGVAYFPGDVHATLKQCKGHCGHRATVLEYLTAWAGIPMRRAVGMSLYVPDGRSSDLRAIRADATNMHVWAEVYLPKVGWVEVDPGLGEAGYRIPASFVQNNRWFQNYRVETRESGRDRMPEWIPHGGVFRSEFNITHTIQYKERPGE